MLAGFRLRLPVMKTQNVDYRAGQTSCIGYLAYQEKNNGCTVLIAPTWQGLNGFAKDQAHYLAEMGYIAFAIDPYGEGKNAMTNEAAAELMLPLFRNRTLLRERVVAAYEKARQFPFADATRIGAIGFCFGGLSVIELLKSGVALKGIVSFHGVLGNTFLGHKAEPAPLITPWQGSLLVLHGIKDPLVPPEDLLKLQNEMTQADIDWQVHIYGSAGHAFTNPEAKDDQNNVCFEPLANARSFQSMRNFFEEKFK